MIEKAKKRKKLGDLKSGELFMYEDCIALKSEYINKSGEPECYILGTGEMFWGEGTSNLNQLMITPLKLIW